jgi:hypothetical protein
VHYFFDTEFFDDGQTIDLISIGIVRSDGATLYCERSEFDPTLCNDFVRLNVLPKLGPDYERLTSIQIKDKILEFVGDDKPTWVAYYASYDYVALCQLFGTMMDLPKSWSMFCWDLKQELVRVGSPKFPGQAGSNEHNALDDAKWNKSLYDWLHKNYGVTIPVA